MAQNQYVSRLAKQQDLDELRQEASTAVAEIVAQLESFHDELSLIRRAINQLIDDVQEIQGDLYEEVPPIAANPEEGLFDDEDEAAAAWEAEHPEGEIFPIETHMEQDLQALAESANETPGATTDPNDITDVPPEGITIIPALDDPDMA